MEMVVMNGKKDCWPRSAGKRCSTHATTRPLNPSSKKKAVEDDDGEEEEDSDEGRNMDIVMMMWTEDGEAPSPLAYSHASHPEESSPIQGHHAHHSTGL